MTARRGGIVRLILNFVAGLVFVHAGTAGWLWERVEREVSWRTGPTWDRVLAFLAVYWCAWFVINGGSRDRMTTAARFVVTSCVLVAVQVLVPVMWLPVVLTALLIASMVDAYLVSERWSRAITAWAWSGAGVAVATLLIHPYFVGSPLFVVRLAVLMTLWDWLGERLGVSPRLTRFVPSLYSSGSGCTAAQARVAR